MHFHGLFLLNLFVGPQNDTDGQQQTRTRGVSDRSQQVGTCCEQTDKRTREVGDRWDVVLKDLLKDLGVLSEPGNLHARSLNLLGDVLGTHVGGVNPELGEDHRTNGHQRHVEHHVHHHLRQAVAEDVTLLVEQRNQPVVHAVDHAGVPGKAARSRGLTRIVRPDVSGR